jgi:hypothetical protein
MAKACKRKKYDGAIISISTAYVIQGDTATRYKVPPNVAREIVAFDRHSEFAPGEYDLRAPSPRERLGQQMKTSRCPGKKNGTERSKRKHMTQGIRAL